MNDVSSMVWSRPPGPVSASLRVYALVNNAGSSMMMEILDRWKPVRWCSLFDGSPEEGALSAAPLLVELGDLVKPPTPTSAMLMDRIHANLRLSNALIVLHSTLRFDALATSLRARLDGRLAGGVDVMLRFFDTRVLPALLDTIDDKTRQAFLCIAEQWMWLDRRGRWQSLRVAAAPVDLHVAPLTLTQQEEDRLVELSEPDLVLQTLKTSAPDLCRSRSDGDLHDVVSDCVTAAHSFGIANTRQLTLFCMIGLTEGPRFHEAGNWIEALRLNAGEDDAVMRAYDLVSSGRAATSDVA